MPEQYLNGAQVGAGFEKVGRETVAQSVRMNAPVVEASAFGGDLAGGSIGPWWSQDDSLCASGCRETTTPWACGEGRASKCAALRAASG